MLGSNIVNGFTGAYGPEVISDTSEHTPGDGKVYFELHMLEATAIDKIEPSIGNLTGVTFPGGFRLRGRFTSVTLTSGSCVAYKG